MNKKTCFLFFTFFSTSCHDGNIGVGFGNWGNCERFKSKFFTDCNSVLIVDVSSFADLKINYFYV